MPIDLKAALDAIVETAPLPILVSTLYGTVEHDEDAFQAKLIEVANFLPTDIQTFESSTRASCPSDKHWLVAKIAGLLVIRERQRGWLHFNLATSLNRLAIAGVREARWPAVSHALLALASGGLNDVAKAALQAMLAERLLYPLPRDAAESAAAAQSNGRLIGSDLLERAADLHPEPQRTALRHRFASMLSTNASPERQVAPLGVTDRGVLVMQSVRAFPAPKGDSSHYIFRTKEYIAPQIQMLEISDAILSADISRPGLTEFYVENSAGELLESVSNGTRPFKVEPTEKLQGTVVLLDDRFSEANVCHFMLDKLSRISLYERSQQESFRIFLFRMTDYYQSVLRRIGRDGLAFAPSSPRFSVLIEKLVISTNVSKAFRHPAHYCSPWAIDFLRKEFGVANREPKGRRKIFISRRDARVRRMVDEEALGPVLKEYGFESHELSRLTFDEQTALFSDASHIVGLHGAGLTNAVFAPTGVKVLEILPALCATGAYWMLTNAIGGEYSAAIADDRDLPRPNYATWRHNADFNARDVTFSEAELRRALNPLCN